MSERLTRGLPRTNFLLAALMAVFFVFGFAVPTFGVTANVADARHAYDARTYADDGATRSVAAHAELVAPVAPETIPLGPQRTAVLVAGSLPVSSLKSVAADTGPAFFRGAKPGGVPSFAPKPGEFKVDPQTGLVRDTHGVSIYDNPGSVTSRGLDPYLVDSTTIPPELRVIQRGVDPFHYEIVPRPGADLTPEEFTSCLFQIQCGR